MTNYKKFIDTPVFNMISQCAGDIPTYVVGGFVRDLILRKQSKDIDIVVVGDVMKVANDIVRYLELTGRRVKLSVFERYGTVNIATDIYELELVRARKESYTEDSRNPSVEEGTLEDDLVRRDFTINSMAISLNKDTFGDFIDLFNGFEDLNEELIKTPTDPDVTFKDDPLRMLRAIRFAAKYGLEIDEDTYEAIYNNRDRIKILTQERISSELIKIMESNNPVHGLILLYDLGLLEMILPEVYEMYSKSKDGHKNIFWHTIDVLRAVANQSDNVWLRFAALFHDVGKIKSRRIEDGKWTFNNHEDIGAEMIPKIFKRLKLPLGDEMKYVQKLVKLHMRPSTRTGEEITDAAIRRLLTEAGDDFDDLILLARCDITTGYSEKRKQFLEDYDNLMIRVKEIESKDNYRNFKMAIDGNDIMEIFGLKQGKVVGNLRQLVKDAILNGEIRNEREECIQFLKEQKYE